MSMWAKYMPISVKLIQLVTSYNSFNAKRILPQKTHIRNVFALVTSYAFIWPMKKVTHQSNAKTKAVAIDETKAIIEAADNLFENGHYDECYFKLDESPNKNDVEIQWRIVRTLYNMAKDPKHNKVEKQNYTFQAFDMVSKLLQEYPDHNVVHKWFALVLDAKSACIGIKERIKQLENVKKHMDLAVTLNPGDATCLHMLGEWCYQITEMPWHQRKIAEVLFASPPYSTYEDALQYFLKAEEVQPRFYSVNLLRIGNCYLKLEKEDQALYYLKLAASYPAKSNDDHLANKEASELLKKLLKKKNLVL